MSNVGIQCWKISRYLLEDEEKKLGREVWGGGLGKGDNKTLDFGFDKNLRLEQTGCSSEGCGIQCFPSSIFIISYFFNLVYKAFPTRLGGKIVGLVIVKLRRIILSMAGVQWSGGSISWISSMLVLFSRLHFMSHPKFAYVQGWFPPK